MITDNYRKAAHWSLCWKIYILYWQEFTKKQHVQYKPSLQVIYFPNNNNNIYYTHTFTLVWIFCINPHKQGSEPPFWKMMGFKLSTEMLPLVIWLPFSMAAGLGEWVEWLLAFLSWSCRDGEVGAEPLSSLPGRLIFELNPGKSSVHVIQLWQI